MMEPSNDSSPASLPLGRRFSGPSIRAAGELRALTGGVSSALIRFMQVDERMFRRALARVNHGVRPPRN